MPAPVRIPPSLVNHFADRVREVLGPCPIQGDFGNRVLACERLAASFEIDVLGEALQINFAPTRTCYFPLHGLNACRLDARSVHVGKIDDARHTKDRQPEHHKERQVFLLADQPVGESAAPDYRPDARFAEQRCEHHGSADIPYDASAGDACIKPNSRIMVHPTVDTRVTLPRRKADMMCTVRCSATDKSQNCNGTSHSAL